MNNELIVILTTGLTKQEVDIYIERGFTHAQIICLILSNPSYMVH